MDDKFYAHSANKEGKCQLLSEHLINVADMASKFAEIFASSDWAYNIGILHDLGKISPDFQEKRIITTSKEIIDHSTAGAVYADEKFKVIGKVIAYCIAGHHAGLPDWNSERTANAALSVRLDKKANKKAKEIFDRIKDYKDYINNNSIKLRDNLAPPKLNDTGKDLHFLHLWIRMLYSCLVDADFLDTEKHFNEDKSKNRGRFDSISKLSEKFFNYMSVEFAKPNETPVNQIRSEVRSHCEESSTKKEGFWELSAPTGSGKTLSSMAFAFKHAVKFHKERIIYVIPYTSIIEQTSSVLKEILGSDNIIEHHSNIDTDKETEEMRFACENWDAPIIVTTHVQFFESLYAAKSSRCRKLHNIVNSIIILDEVQMLPPNLLEPCVDALKQLVNNYKTTVLFSTATQPALPGIDKIEKIIPGSKRLHDKLKRVNYVFLEDHFSDWESVCEKLKNHKQVLCVVNTRKDCYELYNKLKKLVPDGTVLHLSALMCPEHRTEKIDEIKEKLKENAEVRVISTQLIEAGVDIDFPVVYRAFAGIPSIIQTAGRCNREGKRKPAEEAKVFIFMPPSKLPQGLLSKAADVTRNMMGSEDFQIDKEDTSRKFYEEFYKSVNSTGGEWLKSLLIKNACNGEFQFSTAAKEFQIIDDKCNRAVIVRYCKSNELINDLRCSLTCNPGRVNREKMRKLQRYTVNVPDSILTTLKNKGLIEEIHEGIFIQGQIKYENETGLNIFETDIIDLPII
jgi:CRISPR-associated endonuclease/helicase Cas3